jgi:hypothetical protein
MEPVAPGSELVAFRLLDDGLDAVQAAAQSLPGRGPSTPGSTSRPLSLPTPTFADCDDRR